MKPVGLFFLFSVSVLPLQAQHSAKLRAEIAVLENRLAGSGPNRGSLPAELESLRLQRNLCELRETGLPIFADSGTTYFHSAYAFNYNEPAEQANWVAHIISPEIAEGTVPRSNDFRSDPIVKTGSADKADYSQSGYDRGHLAPSADFKWSAKALSESFFYSNMAPQHPQLNRERWSDLEDRLRQYVLLNGRPLYVVTGPVWDAGLDSIGPNRVAVPKRFYKAVLDYGIRPMRAVAFVLPNASCRYPVMYYALSVDSLERLTGINFFSGLKRSQAKAEKTYTDSLWLLPKEKGYVTPLRGEALPEDAVNSVDAGDMAGSSAKVCGHIVAVRHDERSATTLLDFDQKAPKSLFCVSIGKKNLPHFPDASQSTWVNKKACATGTVSLNKGVPTIRLKSEQALEVSE